MKALSLNSDVFGEQPRNYCMLSLCTFLVVH